jgi:hypothetical protein
MAPTKKSKLLESLEEKSELINVPVVTKHEIQTFQEKELKNKEEKTYMSLEERYAHLEQILEETN